MFRLILISIFLSFAGGQATAAEENVEVRFLAQVLPEGLGQVVLANAEMRSDPFDLPMNNLSPPQEPPARLFSVWSMGQNVSVASVKLPDEGKSFIVLLLRSPEGGYEPVVMPAENPNFKGGDVYFYNNANKPVLGVLGTAKFSLSPGKGTVVTPRGFGQQRYYHAMLGVKEADGNRVIKSMKWPSSKMTRNYVFFYVDPTKKRISFRAVDEFIIPKENQP